ncbi:SDR family oxidoreductase [Portibacter lacus]|uniref:Short-chain dehydrogenase n=1 Tax=Portibacter lacus TaxID=1099794 RepID=A0AA37WER2_9BACT|nr:SDR family oxidoreductase [Portibacter lacus]GLR16395.1 short-chain dehydrogenase [Portibacter lacus]
MIKDKVVLITGGSKGIGYGIAEVLVSQGTKVAITSRSQKAADEAAESLKLSSNDNVIGIESDVADFDAEKKAVEKTIKAFGKLDVLVANAGVGHFANIKDLTADQWNQTIETNLTGVFNSVKASLDSIIESKGYIITIASLAGTNFFAQGTAYNASKFGLVGFSQALMLDVRKDGVKVSTIMPGSVATYFNDHVPNEADAWKIQPEDIGKLVLDLLTMNPRTLPSKVEVRPSMPPSK